MKGNFIIPILLSLVTLAAFGQQATLEGQVFIHNSGYRTGKVQYVEGAYISAPNTTTQASNKKGVFQLRFAGVDAGNAVALSVEKAGMEVANPAGLQGVVIGREAPLRVFLAEKGQLEQARKALLSSSLQALNARHKALTAALRAGGPEGQAAVPELGKQLNRKIATRFEAERLLNEQMEELEKRLPEMADQLAGVNLDFASVAYRQAYEFYRLGEMEKAAATLDEALLDREADAALSRLQDGKGRGKARQAAEEAEKVRQAAEAYQLKAQALLMLFRYLDAGRAHLKAATLLEKAGEQEDVRLAGAYTAVALDYLLRAEYGNALPYQQKSLAIKERLLGPGSPETAASCNLLAELHRLREDYPAALEVQQRAVAIYEQAPAPGHPGLAHSYAGLAAVYRGMGEYSMATEAQQKALAIQEQALPPNHPDVARSYYTLAEIHQKEGAQMKALEAELKAIFIQERSLPPNHPDIARSYGSLALIYLNLGDFEKALAVQQKIIAMQEQSLPANHPDIANSYHNLTSTFYFLKDLDSALEYEQKAYAILKEQLPPYHPQIQSVESTFAFLYTTRGERRQAAGQYREAMEDLRKALEFQADNPEAKMLIKRIEAGQTGGQEALALRGTARNKPAPQRASRAEAPKEKAAGHYGRYQVTKATSLRERPSSSSAVLRRLAVGDQLQVVEKTEHYWWKVSDNGRVGYVKALLLEGVE